MKKLFLPFIFVFSLLLTSLSLFAQTGNIKGTVTDAKTGETLIGCNVLIQGTSSGATTDIDGVFEINDIAAGDYNLVISYVSYEQQIIRVTVKKGEAAEVAVQMQAAAVSLEGVTVTAARRTDTEVSLINVIKASNLVVSGISNQQISKSQDRDASEVVRRIPGVTIRDGRFVIVRGLIERYNTVWLNNASTPSSEADIRAFSFDIIPSNAIDRILIFKTPAPELPADFAGAAIKIFTKSNADENSLSINYNAGYNTQSTFSKDFQTYKGGNTDWLGHDDGTRALPSIYPSSPTAIAELDDNPTDDDKVQLNAIARSFNKIWQPYYSKPSLNHSANITLARRFLVGKMSVGNLTSVNYSTSAGYAEVDRAAYDGYDVNNDRPFFRYHFNDTRSTQSVRVGGLMNWLFIFGNNQKIEFRNLFNQFGDSRVSSRTGFDNASTSNVRQEELFYQSRTTYSGQLGGTHQFHEKATLLDWTVGYSYANRFQPDTRRTAALQPIGSDPSTPYSYQFPRDPDPRLFGRLYLKNNEHIYNLGVNFTQTINMGEKFQPQIKAGVYVEQKRRDFQARNIGFVKSGFPPAAIFRLPIDSIFQDKYINYGNGIKIAEKTAASDSYKAENKLYAGYIGLNLPFLEHWNVYAGARLENNQQQLFVTTIDTAVYDNPKTDIYPSINATYNFNEKNLIRVAYGRSVNRPEFREISPFVYYDFEQVASIYGNPDLKNAYIDNFDLRYEFYPTPGETVTIGGFYKKFDNTIEAHLRQYGSDLNYLYLNTQKAYSVGGEIDIRKNFSSLADNAGFLRYFKDFTLVLNASLIKSQVNTNDVEERDSVRVMQGQSPYIVNTGIYWQNDKTDMTISLLYNVLGKRIVFVGDKSIPHTWELPRNSLDFTLIKGIGEYFQIKVGIKDILNEPIHLVQYYDFTKSNQKYERELNYSSYKPGTTFNLGFSYILK